MICYPFTAGGSTTRIIEAGSGDTTVVMIHGLGARADRWRDTVARYAALGLRCIALDLPGHGFADKSADFDYSVPGYARFVEAVMDGLGLGRTMLVGTSLGGHVAASLAVRAPDRYAALVLVGTLGIVPIAEAVGLAIRNNIRLTGKQDIEGKLKFVVANPGLITAQWVEEEWRINNSHGAGEAFERLGAYIHRGINDHVVGDALAELTAGRLPTLLVWGAQDKAIPLDVGSLVADRLGLDGPHLVDDAGHAPYFERPDAFDEIVVPFLTRHL